MLSSFFSFFRILQLPSVSVFSYLSSVCSVDRPVSPPQIAVSHTTACGLWQGGVPVFRGSGVRLQLGRIGMLSCLYKLLSGRLWALISLHRQRLRSMTSNSLPSLCVCVEDGVVPPLTGGCPWASWASCWNCNCRWCCC